MSCGCSASILDSEYKDGICEVCRLQDGDTQVKRVKYCELCGVNICCDCNKRYDKRFFAFLKSKL